MYCLYVSDMCVPHTFSSRFNKQLHHINDTGSFVLTSMTFLLTTCTCTHNITCIYIYALDPCSDMSYVKFQLKHHSLLNI